MNSVLPLIKEYLGNGGFFNPELMEHDKVRDMVIEAREEIERLRGVIGERDVRLNLLLTAAQSARAFMAISPEQHKELSKAYEHLEWAVEKYFEQCPDGRPALEDK